MARPRKYNNNYIFHEDCVELQIEYNGEVLYSAKIDEEDYERVSKHHWCRKTANPRDYCSSNTTNSDLHAFILGKQEGFIIDHENRDRTDCRKQNLRHVTEQTNAINKGKQSNNTSGYVGVSWDKEREKWASHIKLNKTKKFLGRFDDLNDAIQARLDAELLYFGFNVNRSNDCNTVYDNIRIRA